MSIAEFTRFVVCLFVMFGITVAANLLEVSLASADTLKELLDSEPYRKISRSTELTGANRKNVETMGSEESSPDTNFDRLWQTRKPGSLLLDWIEVRNTRAQVTITMVGSNSEYAQAHATLTNKEKVVVELTIRVPRPEYETMAEYRTLSGFNRFRPPALDITADQVVPLHGIDAQYYRHRDGACSLLFDIAKHSIVNLYTKNCADSRVMMDFTKALNFERLISKLKS